MEGERIQYSAYDEDSRTRIDAYGSVIAESPNHARNLMMNYLDDVLEDGYDADYGIEGDEIDIFRDGRCIMTVVMKEDEKYNRTNELINVMRRNADSILKMESMVYRDCMVDKSTDRKNQLANEMVIRIAWELNGIEAGYMALYHGELYWSDVDEAKHCILDDCMYDYHRTLNGD